MQTYCVDYTPVFIAAKAMIAYGNASSPARREIFAALQQAAAEVDGWRAANPPKMEPGTRDCTPKWSYVMWVLEDRIRTKRPLRERYEGEIGHWQQQVDNLQQSLEFSRQPAARKEDQ